jgi:hypothetical protein
MTRRLLTVLAVAAALLILGAGTAFASSVHIKGGANAQPAYTDNGVTLTAAGALAGLGNGDVIVTLTAVATPTATCHNPGTDQTLPPGQNPAPVTVTGTEAIPASQVKNGNTPFAVTTDPPVSPIPGAPGCPNAGWVESITDLAFTSATVTVEQPPGTTVLTVACVIAPASMDGAVACS